MTETIAEQLPRLRETIDESAPAGIAEIFLREQRALASATPEGIIEVGAPLPDAELLDPYGHPTTLNEALAGRPGVLVFYRGAWCPYCNLALRTYQAVLVDELEARNTQLVAVSPQRPDGSLTMDRERIVRWLDVHPDYSTRSEPEQILAALDVLERA